MPTFIITETAEYEVEAATAEEALEKFLDYGPEVSEPVRPGAVREREVAEQTGGAK